MIKRRLAIGIMAAIMSLGFSMTSFAGTWQNDTTGWWYQNDNSTYKANEWFQDADGSWYRFNPNGYIIANQWQQVDGAWYWFDAAGKMISNKWVGNYYLGSSGAMLTNTTTPDGYKVGSDGAWVQNSTNSVSTATGNSSGSTVTNNGVDILYAPSVDDSERIYFDNGNWLSSQSTWAEGLDIS